MLRMAREKEIEGISGLEMFASQAQRQVELFTGESVELDELLDFLNGLDQ